MKIGIDKVRSVWLSLQTFSIKLIIFLSLLLYLTTNHAFGQNLSDGVVAYAKKNYKQSVQILKKSLIKNRKMEKKEKAIHLKYIGMSLYKIGKKNKSIKALEKAYELDPNLKIDDVDKEDKEIISAFRKAREKIAKQDSESSESGTKIKIKSNISNITIVLNNRHTLKAGEKFSTNPGINDISIVLKNGQRRNFRLAVKKNQINTYYIKLFKSADKDVAYHILEINSDLSEKLNENVDVKIDSTSQNQPNNSNVVQSKLTQKQNSSPSVIDFLPFGAGQFEDGKYITGGLFAILQVSFLYLAIDAYNIENNFVDEGNKIVNQLESLDTERKEIDTYRASVNTVIAEQQRTRTAYTIMFAGTWIASTVYAILTNKLEKNTLPNHSGHQKAHRFQFSLAPPPISPEGEKYCIENCRQKSVLPSLSLAFKDEWQESTNQMWQASGSFTTREGSSSLIPEIVVKIDMLF